MTARKKKTPKPRSRRSPYERSLDYATRRLEKALAEQRDYSLRLEALNKEIPYLQTVIRALTPAVAPSGTRPAIPAPTDQAAFLARYVTPIRAVDPDGNDEPFLPDVEGVKVLE